MAMYRNHRQPPKAWTAWLDGWTLDMQAVLLQCLFSRLISIFPQCGRMVFPGLVIMQSVM